MSLSIRINKIHLTCYSKQDFMTVYSQLFNGNGYMSAILSYIKKDNNHVYDYRHDGLNVDFAIMTKGGNIITFYKDNNDRYWFEYHQNGRLVSLNYTSRKRIYNGDEIFIPKNIQKYLSGEIK